MRPLGRRQRRRLRSAPGLDPPRGGRQPPASRGRRHRPLSDPLAGPAHRHAGRALLGDDGRAGRGGQGPPRRRVELRRRAAGALRADPARGLAAAGAQPDRPWCQARSTAVLCYSPMQSGLLSGAFSRERARHLPRDDWRRRDREFQEPRLEANLSVAERLRPVAARRRATVAAVAVAWVLAQPGVTAAIAGARRPAQVEGWLAAGDLMLERADLEELERALPVLAARPAGEGAR